MRQKSKDKALRLMLGVAFASTAFVGCGGGSSGNQSALPEDVKAILFLQRTPRDSEGNVFDYASYEAGGRLVKLEPPVGGRDEDPIVDLDVFKANVDPDANGTTSSRTTSPSTPRRSSSPRAVDGGKYQLYSMQRRRHQLQAAHRATPADHVYPIYAPGRRSCS